MKTVVFLSSFVLDYVDFEGISKESAGLRFVLLETEQRRNKLSDKLANNIHEIYWCDATDPSDLLSGLDIESAKSALIKEKSKNDDEIYILSYFEFNVELVNQLAKEFNLTCLAINDLQQFRDKTMMKKVIGEAGLRKPRFELIDSKKLLSSPDSYFDELANKYKLPFICKPIDAAGSVGVYKIESHSAFIDFATNSNHAMHTYEIEEFIQGRLFHCDFVLSNGDFVFKACGEYIFPCFEASKGKLIGSMILPVHANEYDEVIDFATSCMLAFNVRFGAFHMEVFKSDSTGELIFLEVGARPPGMGVSRVYDSLTNVSMQTMVLRSLLGLEITRANAITNSSLWAQLPSRKGTIEKINYPKTRSKLNLKYNCKVGDVFDDGFSYFDELALIGIDNQSYDVIKEDLKMLRKFPFIEMSHENIS